jgi:hypothetical protein
MHLLTLFHVSCLKETDAYCVSILVMYTGCFGAHFLSKIPRDRNPVVLDPEFGVATSFKE